jgi:hypothetical protein
MPGPSRKPHDVRKPAATWRSPVKRFVPVAARPAPVKPLPPARSLPPEVPEWAGSPLPAVVPDDAMDGPDPRPLIDRRQLPRIAFAARAALAPADDTGAVRPPAIRTRDLNSLGLGFTARQDLSVLGDAVLRLPGVAGRWVSVPCRVRRSRELGNGWYDGLAEFVVPQPELTVENGAARLPKRPRRR